MKRIVKEEQPFERLEISKEDLLRLFGVRDLLEMLKHHFFLSTIRLKFVFSMKKFIHQQQQFIGNNTRIPQDHDDDVFFEYSDVVH